MTVFSGWLYLGLWVGVILANLALVFVAWWALFSDRSRGRRRCPRCWYDVAYSPGMHCSECGFVARREAQFSKTRRRYKTAAVAIIGSVALTLAVDHQLSQRGWASRLPTAVLLWTLPLMSEIPSELHMRADTAQLTESQWRSMLQRCAGGEWTRRPPSDEWIEKYGEFLQRWRRRISFNEELAKLLAAIPPRIEITAPARWPTDAQPVLLLHMREWWPSDCRARVRLTLMSEDGSEAIEEVFAHRSADDRVLRSALAFSFGSLDRLSRSISIRVEVDQNAQAAGSSAWRTVHTETVTMHISRDGLVANAYKKVADQAMNALMAEVFRPGLVRWTGGASPVRFRINLPATFGTEFDDTACGVHVELLRGDIVARRLNMWWLGGTAPGDSHRNYGFEIDHENLEMLRTLPADGSGWSIRVRGSAELALRAGPSTKCWAGEVTMPLRLRESPEQAPPRQWEREEQQPNSDEIQRAAPIDSRRRRSSTV